MFSPVTDVAAFAAYAFAMSITPGPNNAMLATMGARHGWRAAAPAAAGVVTGMFGLLLAAGTGVATAVSALPWTGRVLGVIGVGYMAWLALRLWRATPGGGHKERPTVGFWGAVALQAVNPKALLMAVAAGGFLAPAAGPGGAAAMAGLFTVIGAPCIAAWALAGDRLRGWLSSPGHERVFLRTMAVVVAATALAMLREG